MEGHAASSRMALRMQRQDLRIRHIEQRMKRQELRFRHDKRRMMSRPRGASQGGSGSSAVSEPSSELELSSDLGKRLVLKGYAITSRTINLGDALVWAALKNLKEEVQLLIRQGADVNFVKIHGKSRRTALMNAAALGVCSTISMLTDAGAHLDETDEDGNTALLYGVWNGHLQAIQLLADLGASITHRNDEGNGILHIAAMAGHSDITLACRRISMEVDVNDVNQRQRTPAHLACRHGKLSALQALVSCGAKIDMRSVNSITPLFEAAVQGQAAMMEYLLEQGADPMAADLNGNTPLHVAARGESVAMVQILLRYNVDINIRNTRPERHSPVMTAAKAGCTGIMSLLIEHGADSLATNSYGASLLHIAAACNRTETIQFLVENGADIELRNNKEETPLICSATRGKRDAVRLLVHSKASLDQQDINGATALHWAVRKKDKLLIGYLMKQQADIEIKDYKGMTVLMLAAAHGDKDIVSLLLGSNANTAAKDKEGKTALHLAAQKGWTDLVRLLIDNGADPAAETTDGRRSEKLAQDNGHDGTAALLAKYTLEHSKKFELATLVAAAAKGNVVILARLLEKGDVAVNELDSNGRSALSTAAENGHLQSIELLISRGSHVDGRDATGETALWWASWNGHTQVVKRLLELKASTEVCDSDKQSPLCAAAQRGHDLTVSILVGCGGDVNSVTVYGKTPLMFATIAGNLQMVQLLVDNGAEVEYSHRDTTAMSLADATDHEDIADLLRSAIETSMSAWSGDSRQSEHAETPLSAALVEAAELGQAAEILRLIKAGADPHGMSSGKMPLVSAAKGRNTKAVEVLLGSGVKIDCADAEGRTALGWAVSAEDLDIIRVLYGHNANLDFLDGRKQAAISLAAQYGKEKSVRLLLSLGARTDIQDKWFRTPLWFAAENGHMEVVSALLENRSNIECIDDQGRTPLIMAIQAGNWGLCNMLLEKGAQMRTESEGNHSPLSLAAQEGHESIIGLLIDHGAYLNHEAAECRTPLILAAREGHTMAVRILIEMGADTNRRDIHNRTALSYAKESNHELVVKLLSQAGTLRGGNERALQKMEHENVNKRMQHQYAPLSKGFIRILELHPGKTGDPISFELHNVDLVKDYSLPFEALSYEWKGKVGSVPVQCNQDRLLITPNCVSAIERLRYQDKTRMLWIDAICINQEDKEECSSQVKMMTNIYKTAKKVLMWLGEEGPDSDLAFSSIPTLAHAYEEALKSEAYLLQATETERSYVLHQAPVLQQAVDAIKNKELVVDGWAELVTRSYFQRAWIFQEIILAGSGGLVMCGSRSSPWDTFNAALNGYLAWRYDYADFYDELHDTLKFSIDYFKKHGHLLIENAICNMSSLGCSDARDRVFATLGIVEPGIILDADYTKTVQEVFLEANRIIARNGRFLWNYQQETETDRQLKGLGVIGGLPSWAFDFTRPIVKNRHPWKGAKDFSHFMTCRPITSGVALHVNGCILDRIVAAVAITNEKETFEILKPVVQAMEKQHRGIHDLYPFVGRSSPDAGTTENESQPRQNTYGGALLGAILGSCLQIPPSYLQSRVAAWNARSRESNTFDLDVCRCMEREHMYDWNLIYTEKGRIGLSIGPRAGVDMEVTLMGDARYLIALRKHTEGSDEWYERGGEVFFYGWNEQNIQTLQDIDEDAEVVRLELR
ncbi:uncharacterized protein PG998_004626 [Apiospora kogelbergensis]|uniref:uncharacterized protein n=1 Tax=Apiospora kogelbergensis TaxID=1337665 RepID=UPI00312D1B66